jgi:hypothetical protein
MRLNKLTLRIRYLTLKLRALCWVLRRLSPPADGIGEIHPLHRYKYYFSNGYAILQPLSGAREPLPSPPAA